MVKPEKPSTQVIADGKMAERILQDPVFVEAVERVEEQVIARWRRSNDQTAREECHALLRAVGELRMSLEKTIADGAMEAREAKRIATRP